MKMKPSYEPDKKGKQNNSWSYQTNEQKPVNGNFTHQEEEDLILGDENALDNTEDEYEVDLEDSDPDQSDFDDEDLIIDTDSDLED